MQPNNSLWCEVGTARTTMLLKYLKSENILYLVYGVPWSLLLLKRVFVRLLQCSFQYHRVASSVCTTKYACVLRTVPERTMLSGRPTKSRGRFTPSQLPGDRKHTTLHFYFPCSALMIQTGKHCQTDQQGNQEKIMQKLRMEQKGRKAQLDMWPHLDHMEGSARLITWVQATCMQWRHIYAYTDELS